MFVLELVDDVLGHDVRVVLLFVSAHVHRDLGPVLAALEVGALERVHRSLRIEVVDLGQRRIVKETEHALRNHAVRRRDQTVA